MIKQLFTTNEKKNRHQLHFKRKKPVGHKHFVRNINEHLKAIFYPPFILNPDGKLYYFPGMLRSNALVPWAQGFGSKKWSQSQILALLQSVKVIYPT